MMKDLRDYTYVLRLCMLYRAFGSRRQGHDFLIAYSCRLEVTWFAVKQELETP